MGALRTFFDYLKSLVPDPDAPVPEPEAELEPEAEPVPEPEPELLSVEIHPYDPTLIVNQQVRLAVREIYSDGSKPESTVKYVWTSDNEDVVTVDDRGVVLPIAAGSATITAIHPDEFQFTYSITATVQADDPHAMTQEKQETANRETFADLHDPARDKADPKAAERLHAQIQKVAAVLYKKPLDRDALKALVKSGDVKVLDAMVKNLPEPPDRELIGAALEVRYNVKLTNIDAVADEGAEGSKSIKLIYSTLAKVPDADVRENKSLREIVRMPAMMYEDNPDGSNYAYYDPDTKQAVFPAIRADREGDEIGNTTDMTDEDGNVILDDDGNVKYPAELENVDENAKPAGTHTPLNVSWAALHEAAHGVDDSEGAMAGEGKTFADWQSHSFDDVISAAAAGLPYDEVHLKHLYDDPETLKPHDATDDQHKHAMAWTKAVRVDFELWMRAADCKTFAIGDRVYHESYADDWVSYKLAARSKGITGYQFRAPGEWFAELFAAYYSEKLKPTHPHVNFIKKYK